MTIGNVAGVPAPTRAFQIRGDLLGVGVPEVFHTYAPNSILGVAQNTYWRMFQGGLTSTDERGQLFAVPTLGHFNINSPNGHFQLHTQNVQRARLNGNVTGPIGPTPGTPFPGIIRDGFFLLSGTPSAFTHIDSRAPFTRLHLVDEAVDPNDPIKYAQQHGFRPWQRNGITFTGNSDQSYIGHKYYGDDQTDFVVQWSDNAPGSQWGIDRMKFIFNTQYALGTPRGAASVYGLEALRLWPKNHQEVNMGIGDFFAGNQLTPATVVDPTERVDILNGRLRIRQLPDDSAAVDSFYVMVVDRTALTATNQNRGVVKWVKPEDLPTGTGTGGDCDWDINTASNSLTTAHLGVGTNTSCPERDWNVGIGTNQPDYKLDVQHTEADGDMVGGIRSLFEVDDQQQGAAIYAGIGPVSGGVLGTGYGVDARVEGASNTGIGVRGLVLNTTNDGLSSTMRGVVGEVRGPSDAGGFVLSSCGVEANVIGQSSTAVMGWVAGVNALVNVNTQMNNCAGVYADLSGAGSSNYRIGFQAVVDGDGQTNESYGAKLSATGGDDANYGVWAEASGASDWAGWFVGDVMVTDTLVVNGTVYPSDASLKTNVESAASCLPILSALQPKSYTFTQAASDLLNLDQNVHVGLIAQDLEQVLPSLVHEVNMPATFDTLGNELSAQWSYKGVDYVALIPYLIGAVKELAAQNAIMQEQLAACCASPNDDGTRSSSGGTTDEGSVTPAEERLLRVVPNPFSEPPTVQCTLERAGRMQLVANSADGKHISFIADAQREAGSYAVKWDTNALLPGMYYMTLLLDGEPLVKRAVKVGM